MEIQVKPVGMIQANCYIVSSDSKNAFIIDPGGDAKQLLNNLKQHDLTLKMILLTHGHHDHIAAVWDILEECPVPVYVHSGDKEMLEDIQISLCSMVPVYFHYKTGVEYQTVKDGDKLEMDDLKIEVLHTPGHTKGSCCFVVNQQVMFTGDTLFQGDIGRCDLYGGDYTVMKQSLARLAVLETDYRVYPGHGPATTLLNQKATNPYLGQVSYDDYF